MWKGARGAPVSEAAMTSPAARAPLTLDEFVALVFDVVRTDLLRVGRDFTPRSNLIKAGLDSLAVTQLLLAIEERTGVWVDESLLTPENLESAETFGTCIHAFCSRGA
jgi:acyl carrier protein